MQLHKLKFDMLRCRDYRHLGSSGSDRLYLQRLHKNSAILDRASELMDRHCNIYRSVHSGLVPYRNRLSIPHYR